MKKLIFKILFFALFLIAFNAFFFLVLGCDHPTSVWVSYGFIHWAYLLLLLIPTIGVKGKNSFYLNAAIYPQAISYFVLELIISIVFIVLKQETILWSVLAQTSLCFIYMIIIIGNFWTNQVTSEQLQQRDTEHKSVVDNRMNLKKLILQVNDPIARKKVNALYDALTASATRQTTNSYEYDIQISANIEMLQQAVYTNDMDAINTIVDRLQTLIQRRKAELKYNH